MLRDLKVWQFYAFTVLVAVFIMLLNMGFHQDAKYIFEHI